MRVNIHSNVDFLQLCWLDIFYCIETPYQVRVRSRSELKYKELIIYHYLLYNLFLQIKIRFWYVYNNKWYINNNKVSAYFNSTSLCVGNIWNKLSFQQNASQRHLAPLCVFRVYWCQGPWSVQYRGLEVFRSYGTHLLLFLQGKGCRVIPLLTSATRWRSIKYFRWNMSSI